MRRLHQISKSLKSSSDGEFNDSKTLIEDYEKKIEECKKKTEKAKSEVVSDAQMEILHQELEAELGKERSLMEELSWMLSMYASLTNVIPDLDDHSKISGHIVDRKNKAVEKIEFDPTKISSFETCQSIWEMINQQ